MLKTLRNFVKIGEKFQNPIISRAQEFQNSIISSAQRTSKNCKYGKKNPDLDPPITLGRIRLKMTLLEFQTCQMATFWPKMTFFISQCIYGQKLNNINTFWTHTTTFRYLKQVFKKLVFDVFSKKSVKVRGDVESDPKYFSTENRPKVVRKVIFSTNIWFEVTGN